MSQAVERTVIAPLQPLVALLDVGPVLPELLIFFKLEIGSKIFKKEKQTNITGQTKHILGKFMISF